MAGINKVILIGNLGRDPELRYTQGGQPVCSLNLATTRSYMKGGQGGEKVEETEWHRVTVWGKQAEFCNQYLSKGRQVYVEGRLQTRSYEKDGVKQYSTDVVAETVQFIGGRGGEAGSSARSGDDMDQTNWGGSGGSGKKGGSKRTADPDFAYEQGSNSDDDGIPF